MTRRALAALAALLITAPASAQTVTFERLGMGEVPAGFQIGLTGDGLVGLWTTVRDGGAAGGVAFEQRTPDQTSNRFPLAIYSLFSAKDVGATVRFKSVAGHVHQAAGLAVRVIDENNYYVAVADCIANRITLNRVVAGRLEEIQGVVQPVATATWHELGLRAAGDAFTVSFEGAELFTVRDTAFGVAGHLALWTEADTIARFDRISARMAP
ncbi:hypothetical protein [Alsobacter soli]|nr:hypothetical protein [Alsobacter soli]